MIKVKHLKRRNPKDEEFLELIKVKRTLTNNLYLYDIYYRNEKIGLFMIGKDTDYIIEMEIFEDEYKRRGLATFMHDYIEKDLKIKIVTSDSLTKAGERFYKTREKLKKKNPTDKEFLKTIRIEKEYDSLHHTIEYYVFDKSSERVNRLALAVAFYDTRDKWVYDLMVRQPYRRKGLASYLYDYIEKDNNIILRPSDNLLDNGKAFWRNRLKNPRDDEFLAKVNIVKYNLKNSPYTNYIAYLNNREVVSEASFDRENKKVELIKTEDKYKRRGLANLIYDCIEEDQKVKLKPSSTLLSDGKAFWKARRKVKK